MGVGYEITQRKSSLKVGARFERETDQRKSRNSKTKKRDSGPQIVGKFGRSKAGQRRSDKTLGRIEKTERGDTSGRQ